MKQTNSLSQLAMGVLAVCLVVVTLGYQSARHQTDEARARAAEEHRYRLYYQNALAKLQSERYDAVGGKRTVARLVEQQQADRMYTLWLEKRLVRYEAGTPASWREAALQQAQKEFREAWAARREWARPQNSSPQPNGRE